MNFQPFFDRIFAVTILPFIPKSVTPNQVTTFRFVMTPVVLFFVLRGDYRIGLVLFVLTAITDSVDGAMARTRNQVTEWGKAYDPLADKVLIMSMIFGVVVRELDAIIGFVIVAIEAIILGLAWYGRAHGRSLQANRWGKIKMVLEVVGVSLLLLGLAFGIPAIVPISSATFILAILFALVSLATYGV
ncbi:MAG: CDP-alcohol phosphatidyltransferase family protein [Candidatus Uhrbacteria bacterium]